jgi:hypothetical protein
MNQIDRIAYSGSIFIFLLSMGSCISPVSPHLNADDSKPMLVVEGQITDQEGPFSVRLTTTGPVSKYYTPKPVINADVRIIDDQGNSFQLNGNSSGFYETEEKNLKGIPGNKYTLTVTTIEDGLQYTSMPVLMQEVPDIDSVYFKQVTKPMVINGLTYEADWLNILLDTHDATGNTKYWRWEFEETWEINLSSDFIQVHPSAIYPERFDWRMADSVDNKKRCWVTRPSATIHVTSTVNDPVNEVKGFVVQSLGPGESMLYMRYSILVKQYSLDQDLYNFFDHLRDVNENSGGIYSKIPFPVVGNITCCNGTAKVLGYFSASSVREKRIFIKRSEHTVRAINANSGCYYFDYSDRTAEKKYIFGYYYIPGNMFPTPIYTFRQSCADCTLAGTNVKPSFW